MKNICCLTLIGLPGSGKTTFCENLTEILNADSVDIADLIVNVCYDEIMPAMLREKDDLSWHDARKSLISQIEKVIIILFSLMSATTVTKPNFQVINNLLRNKVKLYFYGFVNNKLKRVIILLDDNMFYRSMRYEYYQLCKFYGISFGEIYLKCDTEKALVNNFKRPHKFIVPEETIRNMASKLEPPDQALFSWEKFSLVISAHESVNKESLLNYINTVFWNPVEKTGSDCKAQELECSANFLHQLDILSRKVVSDKIKEKKNVDLENLQSFCATMNVKRKDLLRLVKSKVLDVPGINDGQIGDFKALNDWLSLYFVNTC